MRAPEIVMRDPFSQNPSQMFFTKRNHEIQTLAANRSHQSFTIGIGLGRSRRGSQSLQAKTFDGLIYLLREDAVTVMDQEPIGMIARDGLTKLLYGPECRRMRGNVAVQNSPRADFHDHKDVEDAETRGHDRGKITGDHDVGMISDESFPALSAHASGHQIMWPVVSHRARRDKNSKLERQLVCYTLLSPRGIVDRHLQDQSPNAFRQAWSSALRFPAPEETKGLLMPADERLRLHVHQGILPVEELTQKHQQDPRRVIEPPRFDLPFLVKRQLLS